MVSAHVLCVLVVATAAAAAAAGCVGPMRRSRHAGAVQTHLVFQIIELRRVFCVFRLFRGFRLPSSNMVAAAESSSESGAGTSSIGVGHTMVLMSSRRWC